jgi:hypothetical protein
MRRAAPGFPCIWNTANRFCRAADAAGQGQAVINYRLYSRKSSHTAVQARIRGTSRDKHPSGDLLEPAETQQCPVAAGQKGFESTLDLACSEPLSGRRPHLEGALGKLTADPVRVARLERWQMGMAAVLPGLLPG